MAPAAADDATQFNTLTFERADGSLSFLWVSPPPVVEAILELAALRDSETIYDLGCADGRVVLRAAREHGVRAVGIERNAALCEHARRRAEALGLNARVAFRLSDFNTEDLAPADVIVAFLGVDDLGPVLREKLRERLLAGARLLTVDCPLAGWIATRRKVVLFGSSRYTVSLYQGDGRPRGSDGYR